MPRDDSTSHHPLSILCHAEHVKEIIINSKIKQGPCESGLDVAVPGLVSSTLATVVVAVTAAIKDAPIKAIDILLVVSYRRSPAVDVDQGTRGRQVYVSKWDSRRLTARILFCAREKR